MSASSRLPEIGAAFLDGLFDAFCAARTRIFPPPVAQARVVGASLEIEIAGKRIGAISSDGHAEPPVLLHRLAGHLIEVAIPAGWAVQKTLPPTTREGLAFLPAFVAYQIERVTPWRAADVAYRIHTTPLPEDKERFAVDLLVVPKLRIARALATLAGQPGTRIILCVPEGGERQTIPVDGAGDLRPKMIWRRRLAYGLAAVAALALLLAGELLWEADGLGREIADLDRQISARHALLQRLQSGATAQAAEQSPLAGLPPRVVTLDQLSLTLPDDAYLTTLSMKGDRLHVTGLSTHAADLVPTLEQSQHFAEVAFSGAITRTQGGRGDRFQLDMRIAPGDKAP